MSPTPGLDGLVFDNSFARLPGQFYTRLMPAGLPAPYTVAVSGEVGKLLGLEVEDFHDPRWPALFCGNALLPGSEPLAAVYSGHQFGVWAGQLGDGRAHLLGELRGPQGNWEIQLKGAGQTPYCRGADGRAVLRSSIREFLCSEAMAALGIPTTRALSIVGSDLPVRRESWESAAVVARVAPSFVRFGSFEHWAARGKRAELGLLVDYVIERFRPALREGQEPVAALLEDVGRRTGELIAQWMAVGFMHGVMNTDNMSVLGLTLDYGPFGFMEAFDGGHICNHSDERGRYNFQAQPRVAQWNLHCLAAALAPLMADQEEAHARVDGAFAAAYNQAFSARMAAKLGLATQLAGDEAFIGETFAFLQACRPDFTVFFRRLGQLSGQGGEDALLLDKVPDRQATAAWLGKWRGRLALENSQDGPRQAAMSRTNPCYVLRNWMAEAAIRKAQDKDFSEVARLQECLSRPFEERAEFADYAALPPDWAGQICVSCSS